MHSINRKFKRYENNLLVIISSMVLLSSVARASELTVPNTFVAHQPAIAADVNVNFSAVETSVDDNHSRLVILESLVTQLQTNLANANAVINTIQTDLTTTQNNLAMANSTIATLQTDLSSVENNSVLELDGLLRYAFINGHDTAEFRAINVHVNDGSGDTSGAVNGLGNLTIGYNENNDNAPEFCSDPQHDNQIDCENGSEIWDKNVRRGSHNLIVGQFNSYDDFGSFIAGQFNVVNAAHSSVSGGRRNTASGSTSSVSGGFSNVASGVVSSISGGSQNTASGGGSSVSGGNGNTTSGGSSSISGGRDNTSRGTITSISGGRDNTASGEYSSVSGGLSRTASGSNDWVAGSLFEDQ
ncbi:MAG: hypothetical protein JKY19_05625 [Alcanivoracaceae bacterium]|nr:hypothetical protein [Alcanivoracaceae bacterium]